MGLETGTYINSLVATNPTGTDPKSAGDDHLRLLKSTIKATFPNLTGAVTPTQTELNYVAGVTSAIQAQLDAKQAAGSYQPLDDQLTTLAGITAQQATDLASLSAFMGTVLNDPDAATARATLGLPALLNQNYGSDGVTKVTTNTTAGVDFNTHTSAGVYNFAAASSANAPVTGLGWIFLEVFRHSNLGAGSEHTVQIAHDMNAGDRPRSWTRRQMAGSWSAWQLTTPVAPGDAPIYACRAWVNFNGTGTVAIRASGNVSSITDNGVGDYTVNFTTAMQDANYALNTSTSTNDGTVASVGSEPDPIARGLGSARILTSRVSDVGRQAIDPLIVSVLVLR